MDWNKALVLGIESSCDETSVALVRGGNEEVGCMVSSQIELHRQFRGVVPEVACRAHMEVLLPELEKLMADKGITPADIDGIAVTNRPGLIGALLVGVAAAKSLALAWNKPIVGVNHVEAHITAARLIAPDMTPPFVALVVSGGHTALFLIDENGGYKRLGTTRDDAAGEAFDKAAAILGLPYPGGPSIEKAAKGGNTKKYPWKNACLPDDGKDFSFSGIKTAVLYAARGQKAGWKGPLLLDERGVSDAAASFQRAAVHALVSRAIAAARTNEVNWIAIGGGVAANTSLRTTLQEEAVRYGIKTAIPPMKLCTDNAIMVAARGHEMLAAGIRHGLDLGADARALPGDAGGHAA